MADDGKCWSRDLGLLVLRLGIGGFMMAGHGWGKLSSFAEKSASFPDPLGIGSPLSMGLAIGAEFFCSGLLVLGLGTRLACVPLLVTMAVAGFVVHGGSPWEKKGFAFMYLVPYLALLLTGPGRLSVDGWLAARRAPPEPPALAPIPQDPSSTVVRRKAG